MQLFSMDLSFPILFAVFSLCTSMLAVLGTVQLVISAPTPGHQNGGLSTTTTATTAAAAAASAAAAQRHHHVQYEAKHAPMEVGLGAQKRVTSLWGTVSPTDPSFAPLDSRPPLSMAKLIMLRHAESQRRANARARTRLAQVAF